MSPNGENQVRIISDIVVPFTTCCSQTYTNPAWQPVAQTPNTFNITGQVVYGTSPLPGVTINLSGSANLSATTDNVGNYQFSNLPQGGNYKISASFSRHYFTPANRSISNLTANQTANFSVLGVCAAGRCVRNGKLAFAKNSDIFTINPDGSNLTNITNNAAGYNTPQYSGDGSSIIFWTSRDGNNEIYRINADGSNQVRLTNNSASDINPYYSPDGQSIVFVSNRDGNQEIYKMNADGSNQIRLTNTTLREDDPAFSPDGQKIIYNRNDRKLLTMSPDGSNVAEIAITGGYYYPSYSPDGSKISYTFNDGSLSLINWTMNSDGTNRVNFPNSSNIGIYSPDGTKFAYICCLNSTLVTNLYISNVNGS